MKVTYFLLISTLLMVSCKEEKKIIEKVDFKTKYMLSSEIEAQLAKDTVSWKYQIAASQYASKGDYRNALTQWDTAMGIKRKGFTVDQVDSINQKYTKINADDYILEQAEKNQVIIINEAHHNSFHRSFTKSLLKRLYDLGYKNLGLEALSYKDDLDSLNRIRKYPIQKTGYYTKDPQFGNLIREALEIGYTIFPYETKNQEANGKPREIDQAKNIQKVIEEKPNEKFLIHCGYDHALEGNYEYWEKAMAGRLTEYTGINPLTIDQVKYSQKGTPEFNSPFLNALKIKESSIIINNENGQPLKHEKGDAWSDIAVFHPTSSYINNRPDWLFKNGNQNVVVDLEKIQIAFPIMVLAYKEGEDINKAVPMDITEVRSVQESCNLSLKKGTYNIIVTNRNESLKFKQNVE
ncbi:hypothetical protein SAMN04487910_0360 [Aquimarina amphilecti]|uniref:Uncharacterized protein n=1 Tax=Aquimarina amphilecti TaxID=1038014 RepID=A0A1H7GH49_AQUAM|nr:hypothetical protein [Aquimarina amphilecti]SEK36857.1 hypothetical protein SAMN04487910_0360 [Aquimarina amphilecti]